MTYTDMTKTTLNDLLPENLRCKNAPQLKKTAKAELIDMLERRDATQAEAKAMRSVDEKIRDTKIVKMPAPKATPKPRVLADRVVIEPGKPEDVKATKAGSKRHLMAEALAKGATIEDLMETLGWNKDTVSSALRTDMGALGLGVERKAGKYYLLMPKGVKRIPAHDADTNRAAALMAACK